MPTKRRRKKDCKADQVTWHLIPSLSVTQSIDKGDLELLVHIDFKPFLT